MNYKNYLREAEDKNRCDLTQMFGQPEVFQSLVRDMAAPFLDKAVNKVVALDAMGFALGGAVAHLLEAGLVLARKEGKIAWSVETAAFTDYSTTCKSLEIATDALRPGDRVVIIDDWSETGAQLKAAVQLVEKLGAVVEGIGCINIDGKAANDAVLKYCKLHRIIRY